MASPPRVSRVFHARGAGAIIAAMKRHRSLSAAFVAALVLSAASLLVADAPREKVQPAFGSPIPNVPGKSLIAAVVTYPPGGKTPSHRHPKSAFITAYVL